MFDESTTSIEKTPCSQPGSKDEFSYIFDDSEFWRQIPAWRDLDSERFGDFNWQQRNAITTITKLEDALKELASPTLVRDIQKGLLRTRMNMRLTPYIFSRINCRYFWND